MARAAGGLPWVATAQPQTIVRALHARLADAATPDRALPDVVADLRQARRLDSLSVATEDGTVPAAAGGPPARDARRTSS